MKNLNEKIFGQSLVSVFDEYLKGMLGFLWKNPTYCTVACTYTIGVARGGGAGGRGGWSSAPNPAEAPSQTPGWIRRKIEAGPPDPRFGSAPETKKCPEKRLEELQGRPPPRFAK